MKIPRRSLITGSTALATLAAMRESAQADIKFTLFPFAASGAPTARTMPDRLAEIKNVKDFGADSTGSADSTTAIQNAVNWTSAANRGTIFFPTGSYKVSGPITFNTSGISIRFAGEGQGTSLFASSWTGGSTYMLDRHLGSPSNTGQVIIENMSFSPAGAGAIRVGSCNSVAIRNCLAPGITTEDSPGNSSQNVFIQSVKFSGTGLVMGGSGVVQGCDWINCDVAARMYGNGWAIYGGRIEDSNTAYLIGLDSGVATTFTGTVTNSGTPNDGSGVLHVNSGLTGTVKIWQELSDGGVNIPPGIFITGFLSGTPGGIGTYSLSNPTFTVSSQTINTIGNDIGASGFALHGGSTEGNLFGAVYAGTCSGFYHGSMGFLGHTNSGSGTNFPTQYHLIVGNNTSNGVFQGLFGAGDLADIAGGFVGTNTSRANLLFLACLLSKGSASSPTPVPVDWIFPTNAFTAQWMNCNTSPVWTFSQLPSGGNVLEGDQFSISDPNSNTQGANVTGSGSSGQVTGSLERHELDGGWQMTANPFTAFPFSASGANQVDRTLPARLQDIHDIRDFGAVGDGSTDDWAAIMACYNWERITILTTSSNLVASFTGVISSATFTGTISGNTLTTSGPTGTIAIGQTINGAGVTSCRITSGSGTSWVVNGSPQTVGPVAMATNCVLTATGGTSNLIAANDWLLNNGGTDASPSTLNSGTQISSSVGGGIFVLNSAQNFTSQAMMTVSATLNLASSLPNVPGLNAFDANNATVGGDGLTANTLTFFPYPTNQVKLQFVGGLVSSNDAMSFDNNGKGTIYFPPGNYFISKPIDFTAGKPSVIFTGDLGISTITGGFNDFIFKQLLSNSEIVEISGLNVVNTHATGGGIRLGGCTVGIIRDCTVTANRGLNDYNDDVNHGQGYSGSLEITMENCDINPGSHVSGSYGIARQGDGPITNCRFINCASGFQCSGGEGAQVLLGCYFETCGTAITLNLGPDGGTNVASAVVAAGCWIKNCSIGINVNASTSICSLLGIRIEGTNGQAPGGGNPQYGIINGQITSGFLSQSLIAGVTVVGNFAQAGIQSYGRNSFIEGPAFLGVGDSSSNPFVFDPTGAVYLPTQIACSARHIYTVATLPIGNDNGQQIPVSDGTNGLAWGATLIGTGTHTTHYLGQWNGSNWTVMGQ